jgi:hypothetical protein
MKHFTTNMSIQRFGNPKKKTHEKPKNKKLSKEIQHKIKLIEKAFK